MRRTAVSASDLRFLRRLLKDKTGRFVPGTLRRAGPVLKFIFIVTELSLYIVIISHRYKKEFVSMRFLCTRPHMEFSRLQRHAGVSAINGARVGEETSPARLKLRLEENISCKS